MRVVDIARSINETATLDIIGIRPGEKLHEEMISSHDSYYTYEYSTYYKILPSINNWFKDIKRYKGAVLLMKAFRIHQIVILKP